MRLLSLALIFIIQIGCSGGGGGQQPPPGGEAPPGAEEPPPGAGAPAVSEGFSAKSWNGAAERVSDTGNPNIDVLGPVATLDNEGRATIAWIQTQRGRAVDVEGKEITLRQYSPTTGWGRITSFLNISLQHLHMIPQMAVDNSGNIFLVAAYTTRVRDANRMAPMKVFAIRFDRDLKNPITQSYNIPLAQMIEPLLKVDPEGNAFIVWAQATLENNGRKRVSISSAQFFAGAGENRWSPQAQSLVTFNTTHFEEFDGPIGLETNNAGDAFLAWQEDVVNERGWVLHTKLKRYSKQTGWGENSETIAEQPQYESIRRRIGIHFINNDLLIHWMALNQGADDQRMNHAFMSTHQCGGWCGINGHGNGQVPLSLITSKSAFNENGKGLFLFAELNRPAERNTLRVRTYPSADENTRWSPPSETIAPQDVTVDSYGYGVAIASNGEGLAIWDDSQQGGLFAKKYIQQEGTWGWENNESALMSVEGAFASTPFLATNDNGQALVVWTQRQNGRPEIWANFLK